MYKVLIFIMILKPRYINLSDKEKEQNFRLNFPLPQTFLESYSVGGGRQGRLELSYINVTVNIPFKKKNNKIDY